MDLERYLNSKRQLIDAFIKEYFNVPVIPDVLKDSMTYSLSAGGKRIRPILCLASYEVCGGKAEDIIPCAAALEFIHTYSLIHDDLPAMDNDDLRRGKPTNHKVFGEGIAILSGDALLTEAFYLIADCGLKIGDLDTRSKILRVITEVAHAAGMRGMVAGQSQDLLSEDAEPDVKTLTFIHRHKTAALIAASVRVGGILGGCDEAGLSALTGYGDNVGLAFQVIDDILDVEGETCVLGKPRGSDEKKKKMTYPCLYGVELSMKKAAELVNDAIKSLAIFGEKAEPLKEIARYMLERKN